jgi:hypothetical protein
MNPDSSEFRDLRDTVIRMHETLKHLTSRVDDIVLDLRVRIDNHEDRLRTIEKNVWMGIGALAVLQIVLRYFM